MPPGRERAGPATGAGRATSRDRGCAADVSLPRGSDVLEPVDELDVPPGSDEAVGYGCTCPAIDNCYGGGYRIAMDGSILFVVVPDCPIHGAEVERWPN